MQTTLQGKVGEVDKALIEALHHVFHNGEDIVVTIESGSLLIQPKEVHPIMANSKTTSSSQYSPSTPQLTNSTPAREFEEYLNSLPVIVVSKDVDFNRIFDDVNQ